MTETGGFHDSPVGVVVETTPPRSLTPAVNRPGYGWGDHSRPPDRLPTSQPGPDVQFIVVDGEQVALLIDIVAASTAGWQTFNHAVADFDRAPLTAHHQVAVLARLVSEASKSDLWDPRRGVPIDRGLASVNPGQPIVLTGTFGILSPENRSWGVTHRGQQVTVLCRDSAALLENREVLQETNLTILGFARDVRRLSITAVAVALLVKNPVANPEPQSA